MTDKPIIPFTCEICNTCFHELIGGKCSVCGKIVCRVHLKGKICTECFDKKILEKDHLFIKATKKEIFITLFGVIYLFVAMIIKEFYSVIIGLIMLGVGFFVLLVTFLLTPTEQWFRYTSQVNQSEKRRRFISSLLFVFIISGLIGIVSAILMHTGLIDKKIDNKFIIIELSIIALLTLGYWIFLSKRKV